MTTKKKPAAKKSSDIPLSSIPDPHRKTYYSDEVKLKAVEKLKSGLSAEAVAREMNIANGSMIHKWHQRVSQGLPVSDGRGGYRAKDPAKAAAGHVASEIMKSLATAVRARDERLECAAMIVEADIGGKEGADLAKRIRAFKRAEK